MNKNPFLQLRNFRMYWKEIGLPAAVGLIRQRQKKLTVFKLKVKGIPTPVYCRAEGSDFVVLRQVIGRQDVVVKFDRTPKLIIDAGANVGYSSLVFAAHYKEAKIIAVEPDKNNCEIFRKNCSNCPRIELLEGALWPSSALVEIVNPSAESWSFQVGESKEKSVRSVRGYTIPEIMDLHGANHIDILKLDIEGAEHAMFTTGAEKWLNKIDVLFVELHDHYVPGCGQALTRLLEGVKHTREMRGEYDYVRILH